MSERWCEVLRFAIKSKLAGMHIGLVVRSTVTGYEIYDTDDKIETAYRHHDGIADWCVYPGKSIKCASFRTEILLGQSAMWRNAGA